MLDKKGIKGEVGDGYSVSFSFLFLDFSLILAGLNGCDGNY